MAKFLKVIRGLFIEGDVDAVEKLKHESGWEFFTFPKCRKCGKDARVVGKEDGYAQGVCRILLECQNPECGTREIVA